MSVSLFDNVFVCTFVLLLYWLTQLHLSYQKVFAEIAILLNSYSILSIGLDLLFVHG